MELKELDELLALKESFLSTESADTLPPGVPCTEARKRIVGQLEVLVASGLVDTISLDETAEKLSHFEQENFHTWRQELLQSIDLCVEKMKAYQQMVETAPPYVLS